MIIQRIRNALRYGAPCLNRGKPFNFLFRSLIAHGDLRFTVRNDLLGRVFNILHAKRTQRRVAAQLPAGFGEIIRDDPVIIRKDQRLLRLKIRDHRVQKTQQSRIIFCFAA